LRWSCGRTGSLRPVRGVTGSVAGRYARDYYRASALRAFAHLKRDQPPPPWGRSPAVPPFTLRASRKRREVVVKPLWGSSTRGFRAHPLGRRKYTSPRLRCSPGETSSQVLNPNGVSVAFATFVV